MWERMKESFERIREWIRRNPKKAALVAAGAAAVLVLAWWLWRRGKHAEVGQEEELKPFEPFPGEGPGELPAVPELPAQPPPALPDMPGDTAPPVIDIPIPIFEPPFEIPEPLEPIEIPGLPAIRPPVAEEPTVRTWVTAGYPREVEEAYVAYRRGEWDLRSARAVVRFEYPQDIRAALTAQRISEARSWQTLLAPRVTVRPKVRAAWTAQRISEAQSWQTLPASRVTVRPEVRAAWTAQRISEAQSWRAAPTPTGSALSASLSDVLRERAARAEARRKEHEAQPARGAARGGGTRGTVRA